MPDKHEAGSSNLPIRIFVYALMAESEDAPDLKSGEWMTFVRVQVSLGALIAVCWNSADKVVSKTIAF